MLGTLALAVKLLAAPALVLLASAGARRWGERAGGALSALPAIAGPVLLIDAQRLGPAFAARAAVATVLGVVALAAFLAAYARVAPRAPWPPALAAAVVAFAAVGAVVAQIDVGAGAAALAALAALVLARRVVPVAPDAAAPRPRRRDTVLQAALALVLVAALAAAAAALGPGVGGVLLAVPIVASVLVAGAHARRGQASAVALAGGMLEGMLGFTAFCAVVAALVRPAGVAGAFAAAVAIAVAVQALAQGAHRMRRRARGATAAQPGVRAGARG